jgi:hypothetical protein
LRVLFGRDNGAVADRVGLEAAHLHVALVAYPAFLSDVALRVVRVHAVGAHAGGVARDFSFLDVVLRHDDVGDQAARFANVELRGEVAVFGELVFWPSPLAVPFAQFFGDTRMILQSPEIALGVDLVALDDALACLVVAFRVVPVGAYVIGGDGAVVVSVGLRVGDGIPLAVGLVITAGFSVAQQQLVVALAIAGGLLAGALDMQRRKQ